MTWCVAAWPPSGRDLHNFPPVLCTDLTPAAQPAPRGAGVCLAAVLSALDRRGTAADGGPAIILLSANLLTITLCAKQRAIRRAYGIAVAGRRFAS